MLRAAMRLSSGVRIGPIIPPQLLLRALASRDLRAVARRQTPCPVTASARRRL